MAYTPTIGFAGKSGLNLNPFGRSSGMGAGFNINPSPQGGRGAYGSVPGAVGMPASRYSQVRNIVGGPRAESLISENLLRDLGGDIDLDTLQNDAARFGVATGMPMVGGGTGPSFTGVRGLNRTEQERRAIRRQGLQDYLGAAQGIGALSDDPNLAANLATQNAIWASAPNPELAAQEQMRIWEQQFRRLSLGGGGSSRSRGPWGGPVTASIRSSGLGAGNRDSLGFEQPDDFGIYREYPLAQAYGRADEYGFALDPEGLKYEYDPFSTAETVTEDYQPFDISAYEGYA